MKVATFLMELGYNGTSFVKANDENVEFQMKISTRQLVLNIDLLAKKLHMLVDEAARKERIIKHHKIDVNQESLLKYFDELK